VKLAASTQGVLLAALVSALFAGATLERSEGTTFLVTSSADPGDGVCDSTCTLREAITAANASPGLDTIAVSLPPEADTEIELAPPAAGGGALPALTDAVVLDGAGATQFLEIRGEHAGPGANGFTVLADDSVIRRFIIWEFSGNGVHIQADGVQVLESDIVLSGGDGVRIEGSRNTILSHPAVNSGRGVNVVSGTGNEILGNIIGNDRLGIDLGNDGVTLNDAGDIDQGANGLQNAPHISLVPSGSPSEGYRASIELLSTPNTEFAIDLYSPRVPGNTETCDRSGRGEGGFTLWSTSVTTDGSGRAEAVYPPVGQPELPYGEAVSATATNDATGETSEFSNCERAGFTRGSVSMTSVPSKVTVGETTTLRVGFENSGPHTALDAELGIAIPEATEILEIVSSADEECMRTDGLAIWCKLGDVPVGGAEQIEIVARPQRPGQHRASVIIDSTNMEWGQPGYLARTSVEADCTKTGGPGANVIVGTPGDDVLCGGGGDDALLGRGGNDVLLGGKGDDALRGGRGFDFASFGDSRQGVRVNLARRRASGWGADGFRRVEGVVGSHYVDRLTGNARRNVFKGLQGRDRIFAARGDDHSSLLDRLQDFYDGGRGRDSVRRDVGRDLLKSVERRT
jgi:CSLREA domain-containing protein